MLPETLAAGTKPAAEEPGETMQKALAMWILLAASGGAQPEVGPTQVVQAATEQVLQVVQDVDLAAPPVQEKRRRELQRIADRLFDFPEMARRALAVHWRDRTVQEQNEFVNVFKALLGRAYLGKLEGYAGEQVVYLGQSVDGEFATVRSKIVTSRGAEIPVDYRLHVVGSRWQVYDVVVQGVSFVGNYRGQFDKIIRTSSYAQLMRDLRARYAQAPSRPMAGSPPAASAPASATVTPTAAPAKAEE
ncbi:MAG TPA: ABC transporter substrate-binding protein [Methylomirabilota bacterium]|nr:ABC transporter substrate-binding protein [Methylomirabilota bacterium]